MFVGGLTGCYCGVLPEAIDQPFRWFVWCVTWLYWLTSQGFVWTVTGCLYGVLPESIDRPFRWFVWGVTWPYWPTFQMVCMGCYLTLLTDFTGVWTVTGCLYGVLPGSIDRPFKCLYGLLLGVTTRSYQSVLTDLSDVCRRCYWVLLWGLTRVYWPTFQVFVWSVTEHAEGIVVRFSTNWVRFSLARFCTDWVRFSSHTTEACPKHHSKCVQTNAYHYSTLHTTGEQTQDTSSLPWRLQTISIISLFYLSKFFLQYSFFLSSFFNLLSSTSLPL